CRWRATWASRWSPKGWRPTRSATTSPRAAAASCRATCSRGRCRWPRSRRGSRWSERQTALRRNGLAIRAGRRLRLDRLARGVEGFAREAHLAFELAAAHAGFADGTLHPLTDAVEI